MTEIVVRASMGTMSAWNELAPAFTRLTGHELNRRTAIDGNLEQPGTLLGASAHDDPRAIRRPVGRPLAGRAVDFERRREGS